ncbi:FAD-dependent oxidoreductase [Prolixibacter sp. SD074]|uniref:FAD-dependent oxidoreductase n=1 Tax=Prolixibacter sp. SD074 TaxID=2652391 RepID=UPI00127280A0|nr:FAD-dependent oxidoreductase [Prolixibacter sp. SD074]GET28838.1 hypothetical protein SD074_10400 [Prolixibacter sp. SD074]
MKKRFNFFKNLAFIPSIFLLAFFSCKNDDSVQKADVVIYGGTSAAVTAAVEVAHSGKTVIVVSPDTHLGGLTSNGLGFTDTGDKSTIGGIAREFYHRIWLHYNDSAAWNWQKHSEYGNKGQGTPAIDGENRTMWVFEPHVAEKVFEDFIAENKIRVLRDEWLDRNSGLVRENGKIVSFKTLSGNIFSGKMFIDATYEGDLMAAAGVSYRVGREACSEYNETWDGVQAGVFQHGHHFRNNIDPYIVPGDPSSGLLPKISADKPGPNCSGDHKIQAYCFRLCMSNLPENRVPFPKPENYDPKDYELLGRVFDAGWREWFNKFDMIPNRKTDTNNHGPFSSDNIGMNYDYPEASYARREGIIQEHENYQKGLLYYVAHNPRVPAEIRDKMKNWGLAKDEFTDNGNWPHQLYIREARRMVGEYITTENDVLSKHVVPEPIGMGSYTMDSHNVQRYVTDEGYVQNEGDLGIQPPHPYHIAYGSLVPKAGECTNLLVPVCVSATHIAYGSIRMEPVFMILGQSAATAAVLAIDEQCPVQNIPYADLKQKLLQGGQILDLNN